MSRNATMFGRDMTFLGVDPCTLDEPATYEGADVVIVSAPSDRRHGDRPSLPLRVDAVRQLRVLDAGDVGTLPAGTEGSTAAAAEAVRRIARSGAVPFVLGTDRTIGLSAVTGVARHHGTGRISVVHIDAHADTGTIRSGHPHGHGRPMSRLLEAGAVRADRLVRMGPCGGWPLPGTQQDGQGVRSYPMTEIVTRGLDACVDEAMSGAVSDCDGVFLSIDLHVSAPVTTPGADPPGGLTSRGLLDTVRRLACEVPLLGMDVVEASTPHDYADITAFLRHRVVLEALSGMASRRRGDTWRPARALLVGHGTTV
ncbi:arginase family protein [Streptomyces cadmiisoli]|uniref:Agmatinase n=1 Tax=Streptomyces cadmiisoli TaxID=2184053 RepID=A0A2Z4JDN9_9ACTN|nr:arginase family protein [Streptomyces cadmiisoli]AWW43272.1 agmatinase [Streptomyces cadmiisoli]